MSDIASILERNRALSSRIALLERELARNPENYAVEKDLRSISRLAQRYEQQFLEVASRAQIDVCRYRIVPAFDAYSVRNVTESLSRFQDVITAIYDTKVSGAKERALYSQEVRAESAMQFGYTFAGSLGVMLTLPSERDLFSGKFDDVVDTFQGMLDVEDEYDVRDISRHLGRAVISQVYKWAASNGNSDYSLDIKWRRSDGVERGSYIDSNKMSQITDIIRLTRDEEEKTIRVSGILVGINVQTKRGSFHIVVPDGESYTGSLSDGFDRTRHWEVNTRYTARFVKRTVTHFATEQVQESYVLAALETDLYA